MSARSLVGIATDARGVRSGKPRRDIDDAAVVANMAIVAAAKKYGAYQHSGSFDGPAPRGRYTALASDLRWKEAMAEHEALMDAFAKWDGKLAGDILFEHALSDGETTHEILKSARPSQAG